MDFDFSDDQESLRDAVRRWVDKGFGFERRHAIAKAGGPYSVPFVKEAMEAGWQGDQTLGGLWPGGAAHCAPLAATYFNMRKTTIYGGSNEVQRNIVSQVVLG